MGIWDRRGARGEAATGEEAARPTRTSTGWLTQRTLIVVAAGAALIALLLAVWQVAQILLLIFASILFAVFLRALAVLISGHSALSVNWSLALVVLTLLGAVTLIGVVYGPALVDGFYQLGQRLPAAMTGLQRGLGHYPWGPSVLDGLSRAGRSLIDFEQMSRIAGVFSTVIGALGSFVIVLVLGIYFAADPHAYIEGTLRLFPEERRPRVAETFDHLGEALRWWLIGRIAAMLVEGVLTFIGLTILGVPSAFILALVNALLDFIPNVGPLIAAVPAILVALSQGLPTALYVAILYAVVHALEGFIITPYIQQRVFAMAPALLFAAQLVLGAGFGILGLLLAPALAVVAMVLVQTLYMRDVLGEPVELP